ncbi:Ionotropic receptor 673 [Blattella germanica]|nr:Ionotropic receptor 673 [Blattella germanica]
MMFFSEPHNIILFLVFFTRQFNLHLKCQLISFLGGCTVLYAITLCCSLKGSIPTSELQGFPNFEENLVISIGEVMNWFFVRNRAVFISFPNNCNQEEETIEYDKANSSFKTLINYSQLRKCLQDTVFEEINAKFNWPIFVHYPGSDLTEIKFQYKEDNYLIFSGHDLYELDTRFSEIILSKSWNSRANFLIVLFEKINESPENIVRTISEFCWKVYRIYNILIMIPHSIFTSGENKFVIDGLTWYPYSGHKKCEMDLDIVHQFRQYDGFHSILRNITPLMENKLYRNFHGCTITVSTPLKNYFWEDNGKTLVYKEPQIDFLGYVCEMLNLSLTFHNKTAHPTQGHYENTFDSVVRVTIGTADVALGDISIDTRAAQWADFTVSFQENIFLWHVPCSSQISRIGTFSRIFDYDVWITLVITYISCVFVIWLLSVRYKKQASTYKTLARTFTNLWAVILGTSASQMPRTSSVRMFFICYVVYSYAINTVYQTLFTSLLVDPGLEKQIETLEELLDSGIELRYDPYLNYVLDTLDDWRYTEVFKKVKNGSMRLHALNRLSVKRDIGVLENTIVRDIYLQHRNEKICSISDGYIKFKMTMYVKRGSYLLEYLNFAIFCFMEAGFMNKLMEDFSSSLVANGFDYAWFRNERTAKFLEKEYEADSNEYFPFGVKHLQMSFFLFIFMHILNIVVFFTEMVFSKKNSRPVVKSQNNLIYLP